MKIEVLNYYNEGKIWRALFFETPEMHVRTSTCVAKPTSSASCS